jgi:hypothetical protein
MRPSGEDDNQEGDGDKRRDEGGTGGVGGKPRKKKKKKDDTHRRSPKRKGETISIDGKREKYDWTITSRDDSNADPLKLTIKKSLKPRTAKKTAKIGTFLKTIKSAKSETKQGQSDVIRLNTYKNNKKLIANNKNDQNKSPVYVGRSQPFNTGAISSDTPLSTGDIIISGKTGQRITKGSGGKLFPSKKNIKKKPPTSDGNFVGGSMSPQPSTSYDYVNLENTQTLNLDIRPVSPLFISTPDESPPIEEFLAPPQPRAITPPLDGPPPRVDRPLPRPLHPYDIIEHRRRYVQKFGVQEIVLKVKFDDDWIGRTLYNMLDDLHRMFDDILQQVREGYDEGVRARVYINHPDLQYEKPIFIALRPIHLLTPQAIMGAIEKILNSNKGLKLDDRLQIHIGIMDIPRGGGYSSLTRRYGGDAFIEKL